MWYSFTQSGGTLTIMNSSARHGGGVVAVDFGAPQTGFWRCCLRTFEVASGCLEFHPLKVPRFHTSCLMDSSRCMSKLQVVKFPLIPKKV